MEHFLNPCRPKVACPSHKHIHSRAVPAHVREKDLKHPKKPTPCYGTGYERIQRSAMMTNDVHHQSSSDHFHSNHPTKTKKEPAECPRPLLFQSSVSDPLQWGRPLLLFCNINNLFCFLLQQHQSFFSFASKHSFRSQGRDEDDGQ